MSDEQRKADEKRAENLRAELRALDGHEQALKERRAEVQRELRRLDLKPKVDEWRQILAKSDRNPQDPRAGRDE